jgi:hypothetical protein
VAEIAIEVAADDSNRQTFAVSQSGCLRAHKLDGRSQLAHPLLVHIFPTTCLQMDVGHYQRNKRVFARFQRNDQCSASMICIGE